MDRLKLGLRDIFGIAMPGFIVVGSFLYGFVSTALLLSIDLSLIKNLADQQFLVFGLLFFASYLFGNLLRLKAAESRCTIESLFDTQSPAGKSFS